MAIDNVSNFAEAPVVGTYDASATALNLAAGYGTRFGAPPFNAVWWNKSTYPNPSDDPLREIIRVLAITGDQFSSISRGHEQAYKGLSASPKDTPGVVYQVAQILSAQTIQDIKASAVDVGNLTVYVTEHGAKGDGTTNDRAAIQNAINAGNLIIFPPGTYMIDAALVLKSNLTIRGAGIGITTIKLLNASGTTHIFSGTSLSRLTVQDLTIEGNEAQNATALDAFHINGIDGGYFSNVEIKEVRGVGFAFGNDSGSTKNLTIRSCRIFTCRGHLIEIDNRNSDNLAVAISDCLLAQPGLSNSGKAAIMAFGKVNISNCIISSIDGDNYGIWLRDDEATFGAGAHRSSVVNCNVVGSTSGGTISEGYKVDADGCSLVGATVLNCDRGFRIDAVADDNSFVGCRAEGGDAGFYIEGDRTRIAECFAQATGAGNNCIDIRSTADETTIIGTRILAQSSAGKVIVSGTNTHASRNIGWKTEAIVEGTDITNAVGGLYTQTIPHGPLDVVPAAINCNVSLRWNGAPASTYAAVRGPFIDSTDATNVVASVSIVTTGTAANFRIVVTINALP